MDFIKISRFWAKHLPRPVLHLFRILFYYYDSLIKQRGVASRIGHLHGPTEISTARGEFVVLCLVRDGEIYIKYFIEHYLALGAKHFVFLDNGSKDRTLEIAKQYPQVTLLTTNLVFKRYEDNMKRYLFERYGRNRWAILADIDEHFDFPCSDRISMKQFLEYLEAGSYTGAVTQMLDMFSDKTFEEISLKEETPLREVFCFYDVAHIDRKPYPGFFNAVSNPRIQVYYGGIRDALFGIHCDLSKHALIFGGKTAFLNPHFVWRAKLADVSCVLLHYKFLPGFEGRVQEAVRLENHWWNSYEYKLYYSRLRTQKNFVDRKSVV